MRVAQQSLLDQQSRQQLEQQARGRSIAVRVAVRSRIVLLAANGKQNKQIAEQLNISTRMVGCTSRRDRSSERCTSTRTKANDFGCRHRHDGYQDHRDQSRQRHSLVHAHHGERNGHQRSQRASYLACAWTQSRIASRASRSATILTSLEVRSHRWLVSQPARACTGVISTRKEPDTERWTAPNPVCR
jgi:hypothetical protein